MKILITTSKPGNTKMVAKMEYVCSSSYSPKDENEEASLDTRYWNMKKAKEKSFTLKY